MPRFRNLNPESARKDYVRGWGYQASGARKSWDDLGAEIPGFGKDFKEKLLKPGPWTLWIGGWGETLPYYNNRYQFRYRKKRSLGISGYTYSFQIWLQ